MGRRIHSLIRASTIALSLGMASPLLAAAPDNAAGYDWAMRCFVAGSVAMPKPADDPDGSITEANRVHARRAFDATYFLGRKLGYSDQKISSDLDRAQAVEMRLMVQNSNYFEQSKASCVKLGLM